MLASPRIVAIDDVQEHLNGLADCLNRQGVSCLRVHFTGDPTRITACPDVRIVFADLHLGMGNPSDHMTNFGMIDGLLRDTIKPRGPFFIILWTEFDEEAAALRDFLYRRPTGPKPFDVLPLGKGDHLDLDGNIRDDGALMEAIETITRQSPQLATLLDWEGNVLRATGQTVSSILEMAAEEGGEQQAGELGRILSRLAVEAVGVENVDRDRFRAVNEALLPILADRIASYRPVAWEEAIWSAALEPAASLPNLTLDKAARLNSLIHIDQSSSFNGTEPGVVVPIPKRYLRRFARCFGLSEQDAAVGEFRCKYPRPRDSQVRWVLVQCQAACDHAQAKPGTLPFYLGLDFPAELKDKQRGHPPDSTWRGLDLHLDGQSRILRVSARFPVALSRSIARATTPIYRLREQVLNKLIYHIHAHGARPGIVSFWGK